ncbi:MAG: TonB-dependent siderophore receptor [Gammaproteobacteria bacterium]
METPVSIQVVPRQVLQDQQVIRIDDAVKNVSGVQSSFNYGEEGADFLIRGFRTVSNIFRNGFRTYTADFGTANLERIEVLKGPASVLYGRIEPGGLINLVTKRPLFSPYYSVQQQFGSYDFYRTTVDATGPLLSDGSLAYRFNLEYLDKNSFRDFVSTERIFVAPSLTWRPREDTELNLLVEYARNTGVSDQGIPAIGNRPAPLPISRSLTGVSNENTYDVLNIFLTASHQLTDAWKLRGGFWSYWAQDSDSDYLFHEELLDDNRTLTLFPAPIGYDEKRYALYLDTTGGFDAFGTQHEVLFGADYYLTDSSSKDWINAVSVITQDIFNPSVLDFDYASVRATNNPEHSPSGEEWVGIYFQDQVTLWDKLHLLGGGRYDWAGTRSGFSTISLADAEANEDTLTDRKFSPRVGLLYQPWAWLSLYGNYVESFGTNNGRTSTGAPLDPQLATQYEAGIKTEFFDGQLNATLAFYHLTKENLVAPDLSTPDPRDKVTIGEARSRGIELDVSGQLTERLSLIGSYSYIDGEITRNPQQDDAGNPLPGNEGHRLPDVPRHSGSLWAKYAVIPERFDIGAGIFAAGQRQGDLQNTFQLPGYVRLDAYAAYPEAWADANDSAGQYQ